MDELPVAIRAARGGGAILMRHFRRSIETKQKSGPRDLVTVVDVRSERLIIGLISAKFPDHRIISEESGCSQGASDCEWIVDPLDGTINYIHGYPFFAVSIALARRGRLELGVVFCPALRELFVAVRGRGATLNGKRIRVSRAAELRSSLLATGFPCDLSAEGRNNLAPFREFILQARGVRRVGSAALDLAYVAAGVFDGFWELALSSWDTAAGALIVQEAGGRVTDLHGRPFRHMRSKDGILASNGRIHRRMVETLEKVLP